MTGERWASKRCPRSPPSMVGIRPTMTGLSTRWPVSRADIEVRSYPGQAVPVRLMVCAETHHGANGSGPAIPTASSTASDPRYAARTSLEAVTA